MTNTPGEGPTPSDDDRQSSAPQGDQPGYWEQQEQQHPQQGYGYPPPPGYGYQQQGQPPMQYAPDHPRATISLVLGILGVVVCQVIGPFAWVIGKKAVDEIDASHGQVGGRGAAQAGYILGIVGTVLLGLGILMFFGLMFFGLVLGSASFDSNADPNGF